MGEKEHEYIFQIAKDCDGVYCYIKQGELIRCGECARRRTMCDGKDRCTVFNVFVDSDDIASGRKGKLMDNKQAIKKIKKSTR